MIGAGDRFERAYALFQELCDAEVAERRATLARVAVDDAELAREVERLLEVDAGTDALGSDAIDHVTGVVTVDGAVEKAPESIGEYEVVRVIGRGGMGIVYEARQAVPSRSVALKVIRPGLLSTGQIRRFQHEAEVLAWLDHPGIAKVFAAGTAETSSGPQPFIAMELVRGERIDAYAAREGLDVRARLELIAQLCDAVHHAHQRGVVHRDLKPANILVTAEGQPKVLDFGIARITDSDLTRVTAATEVGEVLGTLPYMSPEQLAAADPDDVDTRSDVYALGVVAYQILSGTLPLDVQRRSLAEAARIIADEEPTNLGRIDDRLRGDVEWIVAKALAKDKEERYRSAADLGTDLQRHLRDEPIFARPPSTIEQVRKFARRNRGLVAGLAAAFVALATGVVVTSILLMQSSRLLEERDAEIAAADEAITFLEGVFAQSDPIADKDVRLSEFTRTAAKRFEGELLDRPAQRARLLDAIAKTFLDLSLQADAKPLLDESLAIREELDGRRSLAFAQTLERRARVEQLEGRFEEAAEMQREVLETRRALAPGSEDMSDAYNNLGISLSSLRRYDEAAEAYARSVEIMESIAGPDDPRVLFKRLGAARGLDLEGRNREAEAILRELLTKEEGTPIHFRIRVREALAWSLRLQERYGEAEPLIADAIELIREVHGDEVSMLSDLIGFRASILTGMGRTREAVELMREVRVRAEKQFGKASMETGNAIANLAYTVHDLPRPECEEAIELYLEARDVFEGLFGSPNMMSAMCELNLSILLEALGEVDEAEHWARMSWESRMAVAGPDDPNTLMSLRGLAGIMQTKGELEESVELFRDYLQRAGALQGEGAILVQRSRFDLVDVLKDLGRTDEAREVLDEVERALAETPESERDRAAARLERARGSIDG